MCNDGKNDVVRMVLGYLVAAMVSANCVVSAAQPLTITKTATDGAGNPLSPSAVIAPGTQIKYRTALRYSGATYLPAGQFVDQMSAGQTFVAGSLAKPTDWATTSPVFDGTNKAVMTTGPLFPNGSLGRLIDISTAIASAIQSDPTKGDGLLPIISAVTGELFVVNHHAGLFGTPNTATVKCVGISTGNPCLGYAAGGNPLTDGGALQNVLTADFAEQFLIGTRLYIPATRAVGAGLDYGLACWGTASDPAYAGVSCPFIRLFGDSTLSQSAAGSGFSGHRAGNNFYIVYEGQTSCYTVPSGAACPGFIPPPSLPQILPGVFSGSVVWLYAGRFLVSAEYQVDLSLVHWMVSSCWDISSSTVCAGGAHTDLAAAPLPYLVGYGEPGAELGYCVASSAAAAAIGQPQYVMTCRDWTTGALLAQTAEAQTKLPLSKPMNIPGSRKYLYPAAIQDTDRYAMCWDYATNAACASFKDGGAGADAGLRRWTQVGQNGNAAIGRADDYGYTYFQGCAYGLGDAGKLWSFDPVTGNTPCLSGQASFQQAAPQQQYCDGAQHVTGWLALTIANINAAVYNATITVRDGSNTTTLLGPQLYPVSGGVIVIPLSGISYATYPTLNVDIQLASDVVPVGASPATAVLTFSSDRQDQDVCYSAAAPANCGPSTSVTNDVKFLDAAGALIVAASPVVGGTAATQALCQGPQISIAKTTGTVNYTPGIAKPIAYAVVVTNNGAVASATGMTVTDPAPAGVTIDSWTCATCTPASGGAGTITTTIASLAPLASVNIAVVGSINTAATGTLTNTATVTPPLSGNCVSGVCQASASTDPGALLMATKTASIAHYQLGGITSLTYTIMVSNIGTVPSTNTVIADTAPLGTTFSSWTCAACVTSSGTGNVSASANIAAGGSVTLNISATITPTASGTVTNTATITPSNPDGCSSPAGCAPTIGVTPGAIISATKNGSITHYQLGGTTALTYTIVVSNAGSVASSNTVIVDTAPAGTTFSSWTCAACVNTSGTGNVNTMANVPANGSVTVTVAASILPSASGSVVNAVAITPIDPDGCVTVLSCNPTHAVTPGASISAVKSGSIAHYRIGATTAITYTIVVSNTGTVPSTNTAITDTAPVGATFSSWTCAACVTTSGAGNVITTANIPASGSVTITINAVASSAAAGRVTNVARVTPVNPDACPSIAACAPSYGIDPASAHITATKTSSTLTYVPGLQSDLTYTIVVSNTGTIASTATAISDLAPAGVTINAWTCAACVTTSGTGNVITSANITAGGSVTVLVYATLSNSVVGTVVNTAHIAPLDPDDCVTAAGCDPTAPVTPDEPPVAVPNLHRNTLFLLSLLTLILGCGVARIRADSKAGEGQ